MIKQLKFNDGTVFETPVEEIVGHYFALSFELLGRNDVTKKEAKNSNNNNNNNIKSLLKTEEKKIKDL